ncbi:hypothetical protein SERLA73DRAFT_48101, partial [Serpula lacrymans var. lacrymans S7.3]
HDDSLFVKDPHFVFVCWNIIQKKEVSQNITFSLKHSERDSIAIEIQTLAATLTNLIFKWINSPRARPSNRKEKCALKMLNHLKFVAKNFRGSYGYKLCCRNKICVILKELATPALFLTLNPADICNSLLGVISSMSSE